MLYTKAGSVSLDSLDIFHIFLHLSAAHSVISYICGTEAGPSRFAIHLGYPIGAVLGPLLAYPFVSKKSLATQSSSNETVDAVNSINPNELLNTSPEMTTENVDGSIGTTEGYIEDTSTIEYAYLITAFILFLNAAYFFVMQLCTSCTAHGKKIAPKMQAKVLRSFRQV